MNDSDHVVAMETVDALKERLLRYSVDHRAIFNNEHTTGTLLALEARQLIVSMQSELIASRLAKQAPATPDHCYDPNDWEYSMPWEDRNALVEAWDVNKPYRVATLIDGPMKWVVVLWDEENGGETRWFDDEAEAVAALPAPPSPVLGEPK